MKTVLITGVGSGIGRALAEAYLQSGARVYGISRRKTPEIKHPGFSYLSLDLSAVERIGTALGPFLKDLRQLDLVVLNAGVLGEIAEMTQTPLYRFEEVMRINVWANKVLLDTLIQMRIPVAQVVGISSGAAVNGSKGWGPYALSKASLNMLMKLYAHEMPESHLCALAPGVVDTPMVRYIVDEVDGRRFPSADRLRNGPILTPNEAVKRLILAFEAVKKYESGTFLDVRKMEIDSPPDPRGTR